MKTECGYDIEVDHERNRVYLTQWGMLDEETAEALLEELDRKTAPLPDGWGLVNDIRDLAPFEQQNTEYVERGKEIIADNGVTANVRVTESAVTKMQFRRAGDRDQEYHVAHAESPEQADEFLDEFRDSESRS